MLYQSDRKSTRLNSSHITIYTLSLHDALPICRNATLGPIAGDPEQVICCFWGEFGWKIHHHQDMICFDGPGDIFRVSNVVYKLAQLLLDILVVVPCSISQIGRAHV